MSGPKSGEKIKKKAREGNASPIDIDRRRLRKRAKRGGLTEWQRFLLPRKRRDRHYYQQERVQKSGLTGYSIMVAFQVVGREQGTN